MKKIITAVLALCFVFLAGCQHNEIGIEEVTTDKYEHNSIPNIISATIDELKAIRTAAETMSQEEYNAYMISNYSGKYINGMHSIENTKIILEEFEKTTIPVLGGDVKNVSKLSLYLDSNCIHQLIIYDSEEIQRTSVLVYTVNHTEANAMNFTEDVEFVSTKNIENDRYTAKLYETNIADCKFFGEITIDGSYIVLRSGGIETMEEFEECFSRLEFRKIGDLMNELPEEVTEEESSENEQISVTENISIAETTLSEQTESEITE